MLQLEAGVYSSADMVLPDLHELLQRFEAFYATEGADSKAVLTRQVLSTMLTPIASVCFGLVRPCVSDSAFTSGTGIIQFDL